MPSDLYDYLDKMDRDEEETEEEVRHFLEQHSQIYTLYMYNKCIYSLSSSALTDTYMYNTHRYVHVQHSQIHVYVYMYIIYIIPWLSNLTIQ